MRWALGLAVLGACSFEHGALPSIDAGVDALDAFQPTWSIDATSKKGVPASSAEWTRIVTAYGLPSGVPDNLWLMQETTGSLADQIDSAPLQPFNLPQDRPSYGISVPGWTRHAVATPELDGNRGYGTAATGNLDGTSYLLLLYVSLTSTPPTDRAIAGIGSMSDHRYVTITPAGVLSATGTGVAPSIGTVPPGTMAHPLVIKIDGTHHVYTVYTDQERLTPGWTQPMGLGNGVVVGNAILPAAAGADYLYGALWKGTKAELADGDVKKLLQELGWTVTGY